MYKKQTSETKAQIICFDENIISVDREGQNQHKYKVPVLSEEEAKSQRIQINSLESWKFAMEEKQPSDKKIKTQSSSPGKKFGNLSLKADNSYINNFPTNQVQSISEINSMDQSSLQFTKQRKLKSNLDEFQMEIEMNQDEKSDSPQKLRKQFKNFPKAEKISLLCPPQDVGQKAYQFMDQLYAQIEQESDHKKSLLTIYEFLHNPLPVIQKSYMRYIFQIHLYKYTFTFHTCYEFYMRNSFGDMIHLARSEKDSFTVSSSHLLYATNPHKSDEKEFAAKLKYNTVKSEYNLYDIDEKQQPNQTRKLLATGFYEKPIGDERDIKLYIPKMEFSHNDFIKSENNKNLVAFYNEKESPVYRQVEMIRTVPIHKENEAKVREELGLKNEGRRILAVNEERHEKFYMGKKQNQRYVILASGGLTPLQIFTMAILNLDH